MGFSDERTCGLHLTLFRYGGVHTSYDAKAGLRRAIELSGRIEDPPKTHSFPGEPASAFHEKPVHLMILSSLDPEWLGRIRAETGAADACGLVRVRAGVEPERVEAEYGEPYELEPVRIMLDVSADAFEAICRQIAEAESQRRTISATVNLVGGALPEPEVPIGFIFLKNLDVSEHREYGVEDFDLFTTHNLIPDRVRPIERVPEEVYGFGIWIRITETSHELSATSGRAHSISCEGRVVTGSSDAKPYDSAPVNIHFSEWDTYELPERAFFGEFTYMPKAANSEMGWTGFNFSLWHVREDSNDLLVPLLTQGAETRIFLIVRLTNKEEELNIATGELKGDVRDYSFRVFRELVDYRAAIQQLEEAWDDALHESDFENASSFNRDTEGAHFRDMRRRVLAGGLMSNRELARLSREQVDALIEELRE